MDKMVKIHFSHTNIVILLFKIVRGKKFNFTHYTKLNYQIALYVKVDNYKIILYVYGTITF